MRWIPVVHSQRSLTSAWDVELPHNGLPPPLTPALDKLDTTCHAVVMDACPSNKKSWGGEVESVFQYMQNWKAGDPIKTALGIYCFIHCTCNERKRAVLFHHGLWTGVVRFANLHQSRTFVEDARNACAVVVSRSCNFNHNCICFTRCWKQSAPKNGRLANNLGIQRHKIQRSLPAYILK